MRILKMVQLGPLALLCSLFLVACSEGYDHSEEATEKTFGAGVLEAHAGGANPMETLLIHSDVLQENRKIYVQLPEGYERSAEAYPVLYVMDGEWLFDLANAHARYYSYDEVTDITLPRMIVVGIENIDRDRDYTPTPNGGIEYDFPTAGFADNFITFLETELFSLISDRYRTAPLRAIAGWSNSGLFANYVATKNQDLFDMYLCISPAVRWDQDMIYDRFDGFALIGQSGLSIPLVPMKKVELFSHRPPGFSSGLNAILCQICRYHISRLKGLDIAGEFPLP
jgi:hypothetical protein